MHYYISNVSNEQRNLQIINLLNNLNFQNAVVFTRNMPTAISLHKLLTESKFISLIIHEEMTPEEMFLIFRLFFNYFIFREEKLNRFREIKKSILVTYFEIFHYLKENEDISVIINYDFPENAEMYANSVIFGKKKVEERMVISFLEKKEEESKFLIELEGILKVQIKKMPGQI